MVEVEALEKKDQNTVLSFKELKRQINELKEHHAHMIDVNRGAVEKIWTIIGELKAEIGKLKNK